MSTDYDVYCRDCDARLGLNNVRQSEYLQALVSQAPVLARFAVQLRDLRAQLRSVPQNTVEVTVTAGPVVDVPFDVGWFLEHEGHALAVRDEYGILLDECGAYFRCPTCHVQERCRRPEKHEGAHRNQRDPEPT
jgi:hypothetical protein